MILQCSECNSRYLVPDQSIGLEGRTVRCANCKHTWFQQLSPETLQKVEQVKEQLQKQNQDQENLGELDKMLESINARAEAPAAAKPKPLAPGANLPAVRRKIRIPASLGIKVATVMTGVAVAAIALLLVAPGLLGYAPSTGMALADPGMVRLTQDNHPVYNINGKILNTTKIASVAPTVRVTLLDDSGVTVGKPRYLRFSGQIVPPGKAVDFTTGNMAIPSDSKATRFVVDIGNSLELALRRKPE